MSVNSQQPHSIGENRAHPVMRSPKDIASLLEPCRFVRGLTLRQLDLLALKMRVMEASEGDLIFREGEKNAYLGLVATGAVSVWKENTQGRAKRIALIRAGFTFGEMSLIDQAPRSATVSAAEKSVILTLDQENLTALGVENPSLALELVSRIARLISLRLRQTSGVLSEYI